MLIVSILQRTDVLGILPVADFLWQAGRVLDEVHLRAHRIGRRGGDQLAKGGLGRAQQGDQCVIQAGGTGGALTVAFRRWF